MMCSLCTKGDEFSFTRWAINTFVGCEVDVGEICETCVWLADDRRESRPHGTMIAREPTSKYEGLAEPRDEAT